MIKQFKIPNKRLVDIASLFITASEVQALVFMSQTAVKSLYNVVNRCGQDVEVEFGVVSGKRSRAS